MIGAINYALEINKKLENDSSGDIMLTVMGTIKKNSVCVFNLSIIPTTDTVELSMNNLFSMTEFKYVIN